MKALLEVQSLRKEYEVRKLFRSVGTVKALGGVSFSLGARETLAIVGESGCGKTTLAKMLMRIESPTEGSILIDGKSPAAMDRSEFRRSIQMIFQDPYGSLNPRKKAWQLISEPLQINTKLSMKECREKALQAMERVGLRPEYGNRYPHMFSGGQRQRIGIARAIILHPKIIICDEPVSALDVSIQAQILNLLMDLQRELDLSYLFISHDLSVVRHIADRVMVIYLGKVVEYGSRQDIFHNPQHPYTKSLIASTPSLRADIEKQIYHIRGELPSPLNPPSGCAFHRRCPLAVEQCSKVVPELKTVGSRRVACHLVE